MRAPTINPAFFTRCPTCGALVSATITDPVCPKQRHRDDNTATPPDQSPIERLLDRAARAAIAYVLGVPEALLTAPRDCGPLFTEDPPATHPPTRKEPTHA